MQNVYRDIETNLQNTNISNASVLRQLNNITNYLQTRFFLIAFAVQHT